MDLVGPEFLQTIPLAFTSIARLFLFPNLKKAVPNEVFREQFLDGIMCMMYVRYSVDLTNDEKLKSSFTSMLEDSTCFSPQNFATALRENDDDEKIAQAATKLITRHNIYDGWRRALHTGDYEFPPRPRHSDGIIATVPLLVQLYRQFEALMHQIPAIEASTQHLID